MDERFSLCFRASIHFLLAFWWADKVNATLARVNE
jgi:hypothetical protein